MGGARDHLNSHAFPSQKISTAWPSWTLSWPECSTQPPGHLLGTSIAQTCLHNLTAAHLHPRKQGGVIHCTFPEEEKRVQKNQAVNTGCSTGAGAQSLITNPQFYSLQAKMMAQCQEQWRGWDSEDGTAKHGCMGNSWQWRKWVVS